MGREEKQNGNRRKTEGKESANRKQIELVATSRVTVDFKGEQKKGGVDTFCDFFLAV